MASDVPSVLRKIVAHKREEVAAAKAVRPRIDVDGLPPTRGFAAAIARTGRQALDVRRWASAPNPPRLTPNAQRLSAPPPVRLIAELTDERFFLGRPDYLGQIREAGPVPLLRKEFIIDVWQLAESRALGADAVLL